MNRTVLALGLGLLTIGSGQVASATDPQDCFFDDFELSLSHWVGKPDKGHNAILVNDPLASGQGQVLSFNGLAYGGDLFLSEPILCESAVTIGFSYLGLAVPGSFEGNKGGFVGIAPASAPLGEGVVWYAGTDDNYPGLSVLLEDDGNWRHYEFTFDGSLMGAFRIVLEDFAGAGGTYGDVFFDDISACCASPIPEPTTAALILLGSLGGLLVRRPQS